MNLEHTQRLVSQHDPKSPVAEAYRVLRTNLNFAALDRPFKTLLVTSPGPEEGKSTTIANLAVVMAQSGVSTLLVDCDLRKPVLHKIFQLDNARGLTNLLVDREARPQDFVRETLLPGLHVLTSGPLPPNPSELLASRRMSELIEELKPHYGVVLFDSPPVVAVADAAILAAKVDGVLLVVRSHKSKNDMALEAKSLLDKANANILGVVVNGLPPRGEGGYYYYYYYYYGGDSKGSPGKNGSGPGPGFLKKLFRFVRR